MDRKAWGRKRRLHQFSEERRYEHPVRALWVEKPHGAIHTHAITVWEVDLLSVRKNTRTLRWPLERKCQIGTPWPWQSMCEDFLCVLWGQGEEECPITILMHCAYVRFLWRIVLLLHRTFRQKNGWRYMKNNIETQTYTSFFHTLQKKITELWF